MNVFPLYSHLFFCLRAATDQGGHLPIVGLVVRFSAPPVTCRNALGQHTESLVAPGAFG